MYLEQLSSKVKFPLNKCAFVNLLNEASKENLTETICLCFYIRDIHLGLGKRQMGRWGFEWISISHPQLFLKLMMYIPSYGRWDDLLYIHNPSIENLIFQYYATQLHTDFFHLSVGLPLSLCAKWLPTEGKAFAKKFPDKFQRLLQFLNMNKKTYRKRISILRKALYIPEQIVCQQEWYDVDYSRFTRGATQKHHASFRRFDRTNFDEWAASQPIKDKTVKPKQEDTMNSERYTPLRQVLESVPIE